MYTVIIFTLRLRRLEVITEMTRMRDVFGNNIHLKATETGGDHRDD